MGFKIKNISYLLDKTNFNYNKPVIFKINKNLRSTEYKILPYQEIIFDSKLLPIEIKKMEMLGMIQCVSISDRDIDSINNPKVIKNEKINKENNTEIKQKKVIKNKKNENINE
jgi:hypothetical protein